MGVEMLEDDEITARPDIMAFAVQMERVMAAHDDEYGNSYMWLDEDDYTEAIATMVDRVAKIHMARVPKFAASLACYAMFFHYGYRDYRKKEMEVDASNQQPTR